jgi:hypothetical protein
MTFNVAQAKKSAANYRAQMKARTEKRLATMARNSMERLSASNSMPAIRMVVSEWHRDENGFLTRTVTAI